MSYDPPYRQSAGYAPQHEPPWQGREYLHEQAPFPDTFDGGVPAYGGSYADLTAATAWHEEPEQATGRGLGLIGGAVMGFLSAAVAIGVATLAAAFFRPQASPVIAVGEAFIDRTPAALKEFAIQKFGEHDKTALLLGMYVTIGLLALTIGVLARRRTAIGVLGMTAFGLFGAFVAYTRPASKVSDVIPSLIGAVAGVVALLWLASAGQADMAGQAGTAGGGR